MVEQFKNEIENWLKEYFNDKGSFNKVIYDSMSYSLQVGGKRIRPILMLLTYSLYKNDYREIMPVAGAMEMIHTYSLVHDDLPCMDDDDLRRSKPTNHKVFGEAFAVLAGDGLLNEAFSIILNFCLQKGQSAIIAGSLISKASGVEGMIGGQVVDIQSEGKSIGEEELSYMHRKKTGELIKASVLAGAILGGAPDKEIDILEQYGEKLGLAFQIKDDILDIEGSTEILGKKVNSDINNDKCTFISVYGMDTCKEKSRMLTDECIGLLKSLGRDTAQLEYLTISLLNRNK